MLSVRNGKQILYDQQSNKQVCSEIHAIDVWNTALSGTLPVGKILTAKQAMCIVKSEVGVVATDDRLNAQRQPCTASFT